jgi:hypothetical protein
LDHPHDHLPKALIDVHSQNIEREFGVGQDA